MIDRLLESLLLAGCAVLGGFLLSEFERDAHPKAAATEVSPLPLSADATRNHAAALEEQVETVLARPLFDPARRPPERAAGNFAAGPDLDSLRLAGIITAPSRRLAIFADMDGKPQALTEGQSVKGWQIESIMPRQVSLSAAGGLISLQPQAASASVEPAASPKLTFERVLPDQETRDQE